MLRDAVCKECGSRDFGMAGHTGNKRTTFSMAITFIHDNVIIRTSCYYDSSPLKLPPDLSDTLRSRRPFVERSLLLTPPRAGLRGDPGPVSRVLSCALRMYNKYL